MQPYPDFTESGKLSPSIAPFLMGALVGAGIALLLAPAHGRETRKRVGDTVKRLGGNAFEKGRQEYMRHRKPEVEPGARSAQAPAI
jgi:gas vesicle protein